MDPNNTLGNPVPTHINAFRAELDEAKVAVAQAEGRVKALVEQIAGHPDATDEERAAVAATNEPTDQPDELADNDNGTPVVTTGNRRRGVLGRVKDNLSGGDKATDEAITGPSDDSVTLTAPEVPEELTANPPADQPEDAPAAPADVPAVPEQPAGNDTPAPQV